MAIRYLQSGQADEAGFLAAGGQIDDGADSWWAGAQLCFARVALATALAATTVTAAIASDVQQDPEEIPAGSLKVFSTPDEDYWPAFATATAGGQNPIPPGLLGIYQQLPYCRLDPEELPAGSLLNFPSPDEDYWRNPLNPIATANCVRLPHLPDPEEIPAGKLLNFISPDEDLWQNPLSPITTANFLRLPYLPDPEEIPAGKLYGQPDEDYWPPCAIATGGAQGLVTVTPPSVYQKLPILPDLSDDTAASLHGQPDEDFWTNPVAPVPPTLYQRLPYLPDPTDDPTGSLHGQPDEDLWANPVAPVPPSIYQPLPIAAGEPGDIVPSVAFQPDEDFWQSAVAPVPPCGPKPSGGGPPALYGQLPYLPEASDDPAGSLYSQPDEDFWPPCAIATGGAQGLVTVAPPSVYQRLPYLPDPTDDPAGSLYGQPDEDCWPPCAIATGGMQGLVTLVPPSVYQRLPYLPDPTDDPAGSLYGQPDEDSWANPVAPVPPCGPKPSGGGPPALYGQLPYLPDVSDDPAGSLLKFVSPDEDYWQNAAAAAPPTLYQGLPYASGETAEIPPQTVLPPEEDFWQNPVAPAPPCGPKPSGGGPPALYGQLPYLPDLSDDPAGSLAKFSSPDEDYPQIAQITQTAQNLVPAFADSGEAPGPAFQPDEDYWPPSAAATGGWQNPQIARITQIGWNVWPQPWTFESPEPAGLLCGQPDEDFWANPVAPVPPCGPKPSGGRPPALYGQLPYLPDASDDPAGSLLKFVSPDEDYWQLPQVAQISLGLFQPLPYAAGETSEIPPQTVLPPDEDFWSPCAAASGDGQPYIAQILQASMALYQRLPYLPDPTDDPASSLRILAEETEWLNWVAPVAARVFQLLPYASGEAADFLPALVSEEDCWPPLAIATGGWQNPLILAQAARTWMQPAVYGFDEFSSYWWTSGWAVRTHSPARKRASRSTARARTSRGISRQSAA